MTDHATCCASYLCENDAEAWLGDSAPYGGWGWLRTADEFVSLALTPTAKGATA
jgi:hypothetical protein